MELRFFREDAEEELRCVTNPSRDVVKNLDLNVEFDSFTQTLPASFSFEENPKVSNELFPIFPFLSKVGVISDVRRNFLRVVRKVVFLC